MSFNNWKAKAMRTVLHGACEFLGLSTLEGGVPWGSVMERIRVVISPPVFFSTKNGGWGVT